MHTYSFSLVFHFLPVFTLLRGRLVAVLILCFIYGFLLYFSSTFLTSCASLVKG